MDDVRVSRFMSLVLRHEPAKAGITLDAKGWADLDALCAVTKRCFGAGPDDISRIVAESDKQRFVIEGRRIRANQGHSVKVDLNLEPAAPPSVLYHGTIEEVAGAIALKGLIRGNRHHVHLSADIETAGRVARRRRKPWMIYKIDALAMAEAGHAFYCSDNGVWLTGHVPPGFLTVLEDPA